MSIESTLAYIHKVGFFGSRLGLTRVRALLDALGNPQDTLKFVHVAGTNGKGSTCAYLASILQNAGYKTGLYTSPYINVFNERMRIDGVNISDEELEKYTDAVRAVADTMTDDEPTEFETITAVAMLYFAAHKCDIVVLEVGLGGTYDATNIIKTPECAVITSISFDHTGVLGNTLSEIADAKAGIIKGGDVVCYDTKGEAYRKIASVCRERGAVLHKPAFSQLTVHSTDLDGTTFDYGNLKNVRTPLIGTYQPRNAVTAIEAAKVLAANGWNITDDIIRGGIASTEWLGRFEVLGREPVFILDGAHNPSGMSAAADSFKTLFPRRRLVFVTGAMADKDIDGMYALITPRAKHFYTTTPHNPRAMPAKELAKHIEALGVKATACESFEEAVAAALKEAGKDGVVAALGSLYFSCDIRNAYHAVKGKH